MHSLRMLWIPSSVQLILTIILIVSNQIIKVNVCEMTCSVSVTMISMATDSLIPAHNFAQESLRNNYTIIIKVNTY